MADATPSGETGTPADPKTDATPPVTPPVTKPEVKTEESSDIEKLKERLRLAEQKAARVGQVENELARIKEAEEKKTQEELEEQNQFKSLYEQEKAKREAVEAEREQAEKTAELEKAKTEVLGEYSDEVKTLADEVGLTLSDTDETSINTFKEKLDKINTRVTKTGSVGSNNPNLTEQKFELSGEELQKALQTEGGFHEVIMKKFPVIASMTDQRSRK